MKADTFMNAVGLIDDRYLDIEVPAKTILHRKWKRRIISIAAAAALVICPLPTLTAFGVESAYNVLYQVAPSIAQTFKPIQKTSEDNGIEMTVISAERSGSEASVYLAMHDTTGSCPDGEWDLYDSYRINVPHDMIGHCSFSEYNADTHTAYFVVHLETMDGSTMPKGKITFSVYEMLMGKTRFSDIIKDIDNYEEKEDSLAKKEQILICAAFLMNHQLQHEKKLMGNTLMKDYPNLRIIVSCFLLTSRSLPL